MEKPLRLVRALELEEKILHAGVLLCLLGLFFPWLGGQWFGSPEQWNGFGFQTGFIGHFVLAMHVLIFLITASPLFGGPIIVRKSRRNVVRLFLGVISTALLISAFTILFRLTSEVSGAQVRFGIYIAILGSALTTLYAFLLYEEERKAQSQSLFHHPDTPTPIHSKPRDILPEDRPAPPPPPPPPPAEEHSLFHH